MSQANSNLDTELRKLKPAEVYTLGQFLNISDSWKKLMAIIPKEGTDNTLKFNVEQFSIIEQAAYRQKRTAAEIFLEEWGTMGRNRPTLRVLLDYLVKAELFRAADYVAIDLLKQELPKRPEHGPAAPIDVSEEAIKKLLEEQIMSSESNLEERLILGTSLELNMNKIVCGPEASVDAAADDHMEKNDPSTTVDSDTTKLDNKDTTNNGNDRMSDLIKFSTDKINDKEVNPELLALPECDSTLLPAYVCEKQEMQSRELPLFLNEFKQKADLKQINVINELNTDDLPLLLNNNISFSEASANPENFCESTSSDITYDSKFNDKEMASAELPEFVVQINSDISKTDQNY